METISTEEKIDYIYKTLKNNKRWSIIGTVFKWGFRLAILGYLYYFFTIWLPNIIDKFVPELPEFPQIGKQFQGIDTGKIQDIMQLPQVQEFLHTHPKK